MNRRAILASGDSISLAWSADGKAVYFTSANGTISRVSYPDFIERRRVEMGTACDSIAVTKSGVVAVKKFSEEVYVYDAKRIGVIHRITIRGVKTACASPALDRAYALDKSGISIINTNLGIVVAHLFIRAEEIGITPDGRFVLAKYRQRIACFAVDGNEQGRFKGVRGDEALEIVPHPPAGSELLLVGSEGSAWIRIQ